MTSKTYEINNNTYEILFRDYSNLSDREKQPYDKFIVLKKLENFTKEKNDDKIKMFPEIIYNKAKKHYEYREGKLIIAFDKISNYTENTNLIDELTTNKRNKNCHIGSIYISSVLKNSKIVTGYIIIDSYKVLHSIVEYEISGESYIIDYTRNIVMTKKQYIYLTNFTELSSFKGQFFLDDTLKGLGKLNIGLKAYTVFRDEIIKDLEKNSEIFKPTEDEVCEIKTYKINNDSIASSLENKIRKKR